MSGDSSRSVGSGPGTAGVGEMVRARRVALGWSLQKLADLVGCAKGYLSEVETGKRPPPGDEILGKLESFMMMPAGVLVEAAGWERSRRSGGEAVARALERARAQSRVAERLRELLRAKGSEGPGALDRAFASGELRRLIDDLSPEEAGPGVVRIDAPLSPRKSPRAEAVARMLPLEVPLINKVAAGYPREFTDLGYPARVADEYVRCPDVNDPDAFAARVVGDSMTPDYREGDVIVFSPAREVKSGCDCFVRLERDAETTFKRVYFETGPGGEALIRLQPINNAHPPRVVPREEVAGLYVAVRAIREVRFDHGGRG